MSDLRTAAQQALEALEAMQSYAAAERKGLRICDEAIAALRAALAQQDEPVEPVAWVRLEAWKSGKDWPDDCFTALPAEGLTPLYTAPPQRKPLTEQEIESCRQQGYAHAGLSAPFDFGKAARAVERAHGIKE